MPKQTTSLGDYPQAVIKQIELLAQNIVTARKRRHETQAQWARKLGVSQPTMDNDFIAHTAYRIHLHAVESHLVCTRF